LLNAHQIHWGWLLSILSLVVVFSLPVIGTTGAGFLKAQDSANTKEESTPSGDEAIDTAMKGMKSAGKSFRRALRKSDAKEALKHVQKAQESTLAAKRYIPAVVEALEGKEKAEMLKGYRMGIVSTLEQWCLIEKALLEGDVETAGILAKKISDLKKRGHETFREDD